MGVQVQGISRSQDVFAQQARLFQIGNLFIQPAGNPPELTAQIHVGKIRQHCIGCNHQSFQELEGIAFHDFPVLEGTGFGFISIGYHIVRHKVGGQKTPLDARGEACSAAAAQPAVFNLVEDIHRLHGGDCLAERLKSAICQVDFQVVDAGNGAMAQKMIFCHGLPSSL